MIATDSRAKTCSLSAIIKLNAMVRTVEAELTQDGMGVSPADVQSACQNPAQSDGSTSAGSIAASTTACIRTTQGETRIANGFLSALHVVPVAASKEVQGKKL